MVIRVKEASYTVGCIHRKILVLRSSHVLPLRMKADRLDRPPFSLVGMASGHVRSVGGSSSCSTFLQTFSAHAFFTKNGMDAKVWTVYCVQQHSNALGACVGNLLRIHLGGILLHQT